MIATDPARNRPYNRFIPLLKLTSSTRMLKKSMFSPAEPRCAATHLSPSYVLASLHTRDPDKPLRRKRLMLIVKGKRPAVIY